MSKNLKDELAVFAKTDPGYAIAYALLEVADAQRSIATQLKYLGVGDAATTMGAIEFLGATIKEGLGGLTSAVHDLADAHRFGGEASSEE